MVLDIIVINDPKSGTYTAYLKKFPGVVVQVNDRNDITKAIDKAFNLYIEMVQGQYDFRLTESQLA